MNYALHVVRGRSGANTLRLMDGVNSVGRHDDCQIRIRSSQVSRRHCELIEEGEKLIVRDLGSSNGTYVNGKRVLGQQTLKPGDVLTIGGVTLRVDLLRSTSPPVAAPAGAGPVTNDTAEVEALPADEDDFQMELPEDEDEFEVPIESEADHFDIIPLDDEPAPQTAKSSRSPGPTGAVQEQQVPSDPADETADAATPGAKPKTAEDEEAVAQFLLDLKLDEDD